MKKRSYYWDTSIFIAWIKGEERQNPQDMRGLADVVYEIQDGNAQLVTSVITRTEVFTGDLGKQQKERFNLLFGRPSIVQINVTQSIADKAKVLREECKLADISLKSMDSLHLATAWRANVHEFHTFDDGLLKLRTVLSGNSFGICKPKAQQLTFGF